MTAGVKGRKEMEIHVGTSGYGYKEWKGIFYPEKTKPGEMLRFYSERFGVVEINNTFYHMPTKNVLASWAEQVPEDFLFAIKAPQVITHLKRLRNVEEETEYLFSTLSVLERRLGPVLFQFPKSFRADLNAFKGLLDLIPVNANASFEFRSPSWRNAEILDLLRARAFSLCITDADEDPAGEIISTATWGYLRLRRSDYSADELVQWMKRILSQRWERAYVFFKHEEEAKGPEMAIRFRELIGEPSQRKARGLS